MKFLVLQSIKNILVQINYILRKDTNKALLYLNGDLSFIVAIFRMINYIYYIIIN